MTYLIEHWKAALLLAGVGAVFIAIVVRTVRRLRAGENDGPKTDSEFFDRQI